METEIRLPDDDGANGSGLELPFPKYFALSVGFFLVTLASATLLYPLSYYFMAKTRIENTRIDGRKLVFDGKISSAFLIYYTGLAAIAAIVAALNLVIGVLPLDLRTYALNYAVSGVTAAIAAFFIGSSRGADISTHASNSLAAPSPPHTAPRYSPFIIIGTTNSNKPNGHLKNTVRL